MGNFLNTKFSLGNCVLIYMKVTGDILYLCSYQSLSSEIAHVFATVLGIVATVAIYTH